MGGGLHYIYPVAKRKKKPITKSEDTTPGSITDGWTRVKRAAHDGRPVQTLEKERKTSWSKTLY